MPNVNIVLDNMVFSLQKAGGGSAYWAAVVKACCNSRKMNVSIIERSDAIENINRKALDFRNAKCLKSPSQPLRLEEILPVRVKGPTLFHSSFYRYAVGKKCVNVTTVHDFICMKQYTGFLKAFSFWQIRRAVLHSDAIICISESTKKDLLAYIPQTANVPIVIIPQGYSPVFSYEARLRKNQAVFIGARGVQYKNFAKAVDAVKLTEDCCLVVIGAPLNEDEKKVLEAKLPDKYISVEYPSSEQICEIFRESKALLYLSEYEGFGVPPLEAMASGLPVIALNKSSIPEVVGDAAILLDEANPTDVSVSLSRLMNEETFFNTYVKKGIEQAKHFSWEKTAQRTLSFYEKVWNDHFD